MTHTASIALSESDAFRLVTAFDEDPALTHLAVDALEETPGRWRVILYLLGPPDGALAASLAGGGPRPVRCPAAPAFTIAPLADTNWVAKIAARSEPGAGRPLPDPRRPMTGMRSRPNDIGIEIEAGEAFGTGHHGTTAGCLNRHRAGRALRGRSGTRSTSAPARACSPSLIARLAQCPGAGERHRPGRHPRAAANIRLNQASPRRWARGYRRRDRHPHLPGERGPFDLDRRQYPRRAAGNARAVDRRGPGTGRHGDPVRPGARSRPTASPPPTGRRGCGSSGGSSVRSG